MNVRSLTVGLIAATTIAAAALAQPQALALPRGTQYVTSVEGINEYRLDNGLKVLLFRDASKATITVNVTYLVGSTDESYGETGMAHLLEHMLFKGSPKHPQVFAELQNHGAQFNGSTAWDRTNYFETFDASDANLEWAVGLEADRMVNSFVKKSDLDSEMTVVRNEFELGENNPIARAVPARFERRLRLARLRQVADRQPQRHRKRADRAAAGVLSGATISRTTPFSSSRDASTRRERSSSSRGTSARYRSRSACLRHITR